jgi:hypothetical protein
MVMYDGLKCHKSIHYGSCHKSRCRGTVSAEQVGDQVTLVGRSLSSRCLMRSAELQLFHNLSECKNKDHLSSCLSHRTFLLSPFSSVARTSAMIIKHFHTSF